MRIDLIAADQRLAATLATTWIDHGERGAHRASDHAALVADFARSGSSVWPTSTAGTEIGNGSTTAP
jgi:hypothetical protein